MLTGKVVKSPKDIFVTLQKLAHTAAEFKVLYNLCTKRTGLCDAHSPS